MNRIKELRKEYEMTIAELAAHLGVDEEKINTYEAGKLIPLEERSKKMSELFECSVDYLLGNTYKRNWPTGGIIHFNTVNGEYPTEEEIAEVLVLIEQIKLKHFAKDNSK